MFYTDSIAQEDLLDRTKFAEQIGYGLVHSFQNGSESIVLGLNGKWGCGKSTLLKFIQKSIRNNKKIKNEENYLIFDFNPWMFSGQQELQIQFLTELIKEIGSSNQTIKLTLKKLLNALEKVKLIEILLPSQLKDFGKNFKEYLEGATKQDSILKLRKELDKLLTEKGLKLYIFIDDIDRLTPSEIVEIFRLIKLNANFKNTFFIVAYDREIVENSLKKEFSKNGEKYLEKIVQVDFTVPEIMRERIEEIFFKELEYFFEKQNIKYDVNELFSWWTYRKMNLYFTNIRHIYRYMNALHFRLSLMSADINITHFLILEAIRIFDYPAFETIYKEGIFSKSSSGALGFRNTADELFNSPITQSLIKELSKKIDSPLSYATEKSLFNSEFFERYYSLNISQQDISEIELNNFINSEGNHTHILKSIYKGGRFNNFLRRLANPLLKNNYQDIGNEYLIYSIFDFLDHHPKIFNKNGTRLFDAVLNLALSFKSRKKGVDSLIDVLSSQSNRLSFSRIYFFWFIFDGIETNFNNYKSLIT